jgi:hypothetical protein
VSPSPDTNIKAEPRPPIAFSHHTTTPLCPRTISTICPVSPRFNPLLAPQINSELYNIEADITMKEKALNQIKSPVARGTCFKPKDELLRFLDSL